MLKTSNNNDCAKKISNGLLQCNNDGLQSSKITEMYEEMTISKQFIHLNFTERLNKLKSNQNFNKK